MMSTLLYRPAGCREYELIEASGVRRFPPRLPEQPFFYPVTNEEYATQIARDWNMHDEASGHVGYVLRFQFPSEFLKKYAAEEIEEFNDRIEGAIECIARFGFRVE